MTSDEQAPDTLTEAWRRRVASAPDAPAVVFGGQTLSAADLDTRADALAAALHAHGLVRGDRVGLLAQNVPEAAMTFLAAWRLGVAVALLNPMYHGAELHRLLDRSGARVVVADPEYAAAVTDAAAGTDVEATWTTGADLDARLREFAGRAGPEVACGGGDVALMTFTSGTTGPPKGATNTHANVLSVARGVTEVMGLDAADRVLCVAPVFHITGAVITLAAPLLAGSAVVLIGRTTPEGVLRALREQGVTTTTGSITVFNGLARTPGVTAADFAGVRHLYSGGAPVPPATVERFRRDFGAYIHNVYGMTETTSACIGVPPGVEAPVDAATGSLAIGLPFPGISVRVVDPTGAPVPPGTPGELEISGPSIVPGYWQDPEATAATLPGGALRTGDGAVLDEDGWVYIVDRLKDQINTSGYKVWPREVEEALLGHPEVHEAAAVGAPDDYRGEAVVAFVTTTAGSSVTGDALREAVRGELAAYKVPRRITVVAELPKTASGKIRRRDLREETLLGQGGDEASPEPTEPTESTHPQEHTR